MRRCDWTELQLRTLDSLWGKLPPEEIGRRIGRSRGAVIVKASKRGLSAVIPKPKKKMRRIPGPRATGWKQSPDGRTRVFVLFDDDQFKAINARAMREGTTFSEQVRNLVQWGFDSLDEDGDEWEDAA